MRIEDAKHAFITGGASGIGLGIAGALIERGVSVSLTDVNEDALAEAVAELGERARGTILDVRDRAGWAAARAEAEAAFGLVDILVNNAGISPDGKHLADISPESFDRVMAINLTGVFNGISEFGGAMREAGRGHIVNTSSMSGMVMDGPGLGAYGASKAGVIAISEVLRMEMELNGIGVSVLCPSYVATNLMENTQRIGAEVPDPDASLLGAEMKPAEVGQMVLAAIEANRPFIFTHPERLEAVDARHDSIRSSVT